MFGLAPVLYLSYRENDRQMNLRRHYLDENIRQIKEAIDDRIGAIVRPKLVFELHGPNPNGTTFYTPSPWYPKPGHTFMYVRNGKPYKLSSDKYLGSHVAPGEVFRLYEIEDQK